MLRTFLILFLFNFLTNSVLAQDTLVYVQENSVMFSNKYFLYPNTKTFEHKYRTDDGQLWYGKGSYEIKKNKLFLNFKKNLNAINKDSLIKKKYDALKNDSLTIIFLENKTEPSVGTIVHNKMEYSTNFDGIIKISKKVFNKNDLIEVKYSELDKIELNNIDELNTITIMNIFEDIHYESDFQRILKIRNDILISEDFYGTSTKERVKFILISERIN